MKAPNGRKIIGTLEQLYGVAYIHGDSTKDDYDHLGETKINWDGQETVTRDGEVIFIDDQGNEWQSSQVIDE